MAIYPKVIITTEMLSSAKQFVNRVSVDRTKASEIDTLTGILGEFVFAGYFYGDWKKHHVGKNRGKEDFAGIEIKTSAFPFSENLHLLVRQDYAQKRKPKFYVQIILNVDSFHANEIKPGTAALICGFATAQEVGNTPLKDFGSKMGGSGGYKCHYISIKNLHPVQDLLNY